MLTAQRLVVAGSLGAYQYLNIDLISLRWRQLMAKYRKKVLQEPIGQAPDDRFLMVTQTNSGKHLPLPSFVLHLGLAFCSSSRDIGRVKTSATS